MEEAEAKAANLAWWDQAARVHEASAHYDLDGFAAGQDRLRPFELAEVGPVDGLDLVHLQCHVGTDTLSWARHGARVVGLDFSPEALAVATELAQRSGLDAEFVCADVLDAPAALGGRTFDVVYTGIGTLNWLPDLAPWAAAVAALVRPGAFVYVLEIHPQVFAVLGDGRTVTYDTIDAPLHVERVQGTYAVPDATLDEPMTVERAHPLSAVVTALLDAGLVLELLHEQAFTNAPWPWLERGEDGLYRFPEGFPRYPLTYSLRARKPA